MDSFPGMESLHQAPVPSTTEIHSSPQILPRPPQWSKRPVRASFGVRNQFYNFESIYTFKLKSNIANFLFSSEEN